MEFQKVILVHGERMYYYTEMPDSINPATEELLASYETMPVSELHEIAAVTHMAAREWSREAVTTRAGLANAAGEVLEQRRDELALLITREMGKPVRESRAEIDKCVLLCEFYSSNGPRLLADESIETEARKSYTRCEPLGVVLGVMPWNFPFWQVFRFAIPTLTAGNGALLKHASNVTGCSLAIESVFKQAGYPENLFRSLIARGADTAGLIAGESVQAVTLTGSEAAGSAVAAAAGKAIKKSVLELGGSDPYLILKDADLDLAAEKCARGRLFNGGQTCIAAKRFIVESAVIDSFVERLTGWISKFRQGDPELDETDLGPMARPDLREEIHDQVSRSIQAGAKLVMGGEMPSGRGYYYPPTILTNVHPAMPVAKEETFGPVAVVLQADDLEHAINLANQSEFGLGAAVFTSDLRTAEAVAHRIQAGTCFVNDFVKSDPRMPFGGIRKSGYGRELAREGIREFVNLKSVVLNS